MLSVEYGLEDEADKSTTYNSEQHISSSRPARRDKGGQRPTISLYKLWVVLAVLTLIVIAGVVYLGVMDTDYAITNGDQQSSMDKELNTTTNISSFNIAKNQDKKCKETFEWSMIDNWHIDSKISNGEVTKISLSMKRMGGPSATGIIGMSVLIRKKSNQNNLTVVDTRRIKEIMQGNLWHRMAPQYASWVALQTTERRFHLVSNTTKYLFDCSGGKSIDKLPTEWSKIGGDDLSCDSNILQDADIIIHPPSNGLLWDLAWDMDFLCYNSDMFQTFANLLADRERPMTPVGCFISRQGRGLREVSNFDQVMTMMKEVFPRVREVKLTSQHTIDQTIDILYECKVLFGVHGAGLMNSIFTRSGVAVVEMVGKGSKKGNKPAYFHNINMMLGQHHEFISGDASKTIEDQYYNVNITEAKAALIRAREFAMTWLEENN